MWEEFKFAVNFRAGDTKPIKRGSSRAASKSLLSKSNAESLNKYGVIGDEVNNHIKYSANSNSICFLNPFISITPSKPLMSSGSWLTLHNCEIFYLLADNRSNFHQGQYLPRARGGGLTADFLTHSFYQGHYLPCVLTPQY